MLVGPTDYMLTVLIAGVFGRLRSLAPGLRLAVRPIDSRTLSNELRRRGLDIALTIPEFSPGNLYSEVLYHERYIGVMRRGHPLAGGPVSPDAFCNAQHLLVSPDRGDFRGPTDVALGRIGRQRHVGLVVPGFSAVDAVLIRSDLLAAIPDRRRTRASVGAHRQQVGCIRAAARYPRLRADGSSAGARALRSVAHLVQGAMRADCKPAPKAVEEGLPKAANAAFARRPDNRYASEQKGRRAPGRECSPTHRTTLRVVQRRSNYPSRPLLPNNMH